MGEKMQVRVEKINFSILFLLMCLTVFRCASADLSLNGVKCGTRTCKQNEYCSDFDKLCKSCVEICDPKHHNNDANICVRDCQDYIHDIRYVRKDGTTGAGSDLNDVVQRLHFMVSVSLTLTCLVLAILLAVLCFQLYKWKKRNNVTWVTLKNKLLFKKSDTNPENKTSNNGVSVAVTAQSGKPDLRLEMPQSPTASFTPSTVTTSISRRPVEDCNLDYAYDNPAMTTTPSPNKPHETIR